MAVSNFILSLQPTRLNVFKNDQDTWDYTNPNLSGQGNPDGYFVLNTPPCLFTGLVHFIDLDWGYVMPLGSLWTWEGLDQFWPLSLLKGQS